MLKVKQIVIENFRGLRLPITIDFEKGGIKSSVAIYGRNGTGKSSIIDAWEWLINFEIDDLNKEGVSAKDYPHRSSKGDNVYIHVTFDHATIPYAKAVFNKSKISTPVTTGNYAELKALAVYPNYLRYSDLQS